jgi:hypothetical protein
MLSQLFRDGDGDNTRPNIGGIAAIWTSDKAVVRQ